jgi:hypothetical protein
MKTLLQFAILISIYGCIYTTSDIKNDDMLGTQVSLSKIITPSLLSKDILFPIIAVGESNEIQELTLFQTVPLTFNLKFGTTVQKSTPALLQSIVNNDSSVIIEDSITTISGIWPDSLNQISGGLFYISDDVEILSGQSVLISGPTTFIINHLKNIRNNGVIQVNGSVSTYVSFLSSESTQPWGGVISSGVASFKHTIFSGGGGNTTDEFVTGHSGSQAVIHTKSGGQTTILNSFIVHNLGKGGTSYDATISIDSTLFAFCDMGGEYERSEVSINNSTFQFFPNADTVEFIDDDNDCLYMEGAKGNTEDSIYSFIRNSYLGYGKDDGIDHNGSFLKIDNIIIDHFENEGIACSNSNVMSLTNGKITRCEQAVEAGYGSPTVLVNHSDLLFNEIGVRFGDWYDWGCTGSITVNNSIILHNKKNLFNLDIMTGYAIDSLMSINYSIIDVDTIYNGSNNYIESIDRALLEDGNQFNKDLYKTSDNKPVGRNE